MNQRLLAVAVSLLAGAVTLPGCDSCGNTKDAAPAAREPASGVGREAVATRPAPAAPTPPPQALSDCFVFVDAEPDYGDAPLSAEFTTELECENKDAAYSWDFGDGAKAGNKPNPSHTYTKAGDYVATVTVTTPEGEVGSDEIDIFVDEPEAD